MRVVFMGTPGFSAAILENLIGAHDVVGVFTRADAVRGRGKKLIPSPVKQIAQQHGIPVFTPKTLRDPEMHQLIQSLQPDVICVAAYGMILPYDVLIIPKYGCLNVHASLLPRWRGAAPVERAILAGDDRTGVCIMRMEEGLDTGDYCIVRETEIGDKDALELTSELSGLGSQALLTALAQIEQGTIEWTKQDDFSVTYAEKIEKREFYLHPEEPSYRALRKVQASSPAHPARCTIAGREVAVSKAQRVPLSVRNDLDLRPGMVALFQKRLYLGFAEEPIELVEVKPEGKKTMPGRDFAGGIQNIKGGNVTWGYLDV